MRLLSFPQVSPRVADAVRAARAAARAGDDDMLAAFGDDVAAVGGRRGAGLPASAAGALHPKLGLRPLAALRIVPVLFSQVRVPRHM